MKGLESIGSYITGAASKKKFLVLSLLLHAANGQVYAGLNIIRVWI